jgi:hypothetical protein
MSLLCAQEMTAASAKTAGAGATRATPSVVVGVKRPRSPSPALRGTEVSETEYLDLLATLEHCELPRDVRVQLASAVFNSAVIVKWPTQFYDARRAWTEIVRRNDAELEKRMLPVLLRSGLRDDLNSINMRGYTALTGAFRYSAHAGIALLREHDRDAVNCPLDFDVRGKRYSLFPERQSAILSATRRFCREVDESHWPWLMYIARHSSPESLNMSMAGRPLGVFYDAVTALDLKTTEAILTILTHPDVSPDDESKLRLLDGMSCVWARRSIYSWRVTCPTNTQARWITTQEFLVRRFGPDARTAVRLLDDGESRQSAYRTRVINTTLAALDTGLPITVLRTLVVSYLPRPLPVVPNR